MCVAGPRGFVLRLNNFVILLHLLFFEIPPFCYKPATRGLCVGIAIPTTRGLLIFDRAHRARNGIPHPGAVPARCSSEINSDLTSQTSLQIIVGLIRGKGSRGILQKKTHHYDNRSQINVLAKLFLLIDRSIRKYSLFNAKFLISPNNSDLTDFYLKRGPERPLEKNER